MRRDTGHLAVTPRSGMALLGWDLGEPAVVRRGEQGGMMRRWPPARPLSRFLVDPAGLDHQPHVFRVRQQADVV